MKSNRSFRPLLLAGAVAFASVAFVFPAQADHGPARGPDPEQRLEHMTARLGLEGNQIELVRAVLENSRERAGEIARKARGERRPAMEALREETDARLAGILTPEQMQAMHTARAERHAHRSERQEVRREANFERLVERLELTDSQLEPVREILDAGRAQERAIMQAARAEGAPRDSVREQLGAIRAETTAELEGVLTPAQLEAFLAFHEARGKGRSPHR